MLPRNGHHHEPLSAGRKHAGIRPVSPPLVRPGQIAFSPGLGRLLVTAIDGMPDSTPQTASPERRHSTARAESHAKQTFHADKRPR